MVCFLPGDLCGRAVIHSLMKLSEQPPGRWKKSFNYCFLLDTYLRLWSDTCKADKAQEPGHSFHAGLQSTGTETGPSSLGKERQGV